MRATDRVRGSRTQSRTAESSTRSDRTMLAVPHALECSTAAAPATKLGNDRLLNSRRNLKSLRDVSASRRVRAEGLCCARKGPGGGEGVVWAVLRTTQEFADKLANKR